jgi:hypothetical protein
MADVEATFRLHDRASRPARDIKQEMEALDRAALRAGASLDTVGSQKQEQQMGRATKSMRTLNNETQRGNSLAGVFRNRWVMIAGAVVAAAPGVARLAGIIGQLSGSLLNAIGGAGVIGGGALGAFIVGLGSVGIVAKGVASDLKASQKALDTYNTAVKLHGATSKQAALDAQKLNIALKAAPAGTMTLLTNVKALKAEWKSATEAARGYLVQAAGHVVGRVRQAGPQLASMVNANTQAFSQGAVGFFDRILSPDSMRSLSQISAGFRRDMPIASDALSNLVLSMGRLIAAAQPFATQFIARFDEWTKHLNIASQDTEYLRFRMAGMVDQFKRWMNLGGAVIRFLQELSRSAQGGGAEVKGIADSLDRVTRWMQDNPVKMARFWQQSTTLAFQLGHTVEWIFKLFGSLNSSLGGTWDALMKIVGNLGPQLLRTFNEVATTLSMVSGGIAGLGTPLSMILSLVNTLLGGVNWLLRHVPGLGAILSGALAAVGIIKMATWMGRFVGIIPKATSEMAALTAATNAAATASERLALSGGVGMVGGRGGAVAIGGLGSRMNPIIAGGGVTAAETAATTGARLGRFSQIPLLAAAGGAAAKARGLGAVRGVLGGFRGGAGPLGMGVLIGSTALSMVPSKYMPGGATTTGALSAIGTGASIGAIAGLVGGPLAPITSGVGALIGGGIGGGIYAAQHIFGGRRGTTQAQGLQAGLASDLGGLGGSNPRTLSQINAQIQVLQSYARMTRGMNDQSSREFHKNVVADLSLLKSVQPQMRAMERHADVNKTVGFGQSLGGAFNVVSGARGPAAGMRFVTQQALAEWSKLGPAGKENLARNLMSWGAQMRQQNPDLVKPFDELKDSIIGKFKETTDHLRQVSPANWNAIATAMATPIEQARESINANLTAIQQRAVGALVAMGLSGKAAATLVAGMESGNASATGLAGAIGSGAVSAGGVMSPHAGGGRIVGSGLRDTVSMGRNLVAPGELVVNRHSEARANQVLGMHGLSLGGLVAGESRPHSFPTRYATGGRVSSGSLFPGSSALPGLPGALVDTTGLLVSAATATRLNAILGGGAGKRAGGGMAGLAGGTSGSNQKLGYQMMLAMGWPASEWPALKALWNGESGWSAAAYNSSSGATGIPQSLPGRKMASAGADWRTNPATQIKWGLGYIAGRYGTPSNAYSQWMGRAPHWYGDGADFIARRPQMIGVGDKGDERVTITPTRRGKVSYGRGGGGINLGGIHIDRIDATGPSGAIKSMIVGEVRDALAEIADELHRVGMSPEEELTR